MVGIFGSAPCASSSRITATSPASAAVRNGVWPVKSTHESEPVTCRKCRLNGGTSFVLALRVAPRSIDRKSTRLNSSHDQISYAVFFLKKKKKRSDVQRQL